MKIFDYLRDPVWQFIGAIISLLALVVTLWPNLKITAGEPTMSMCNYQQFSVFNTDPAPPDVRDKLRLIFRGKEIPVTELSVTQFCLSNHTGRVVENSDFVQPLSFTPSEGVDVIYVRSYREESTTAVATNWRHSEKNKWEMTPTVLNPEETLWIQLIYRVPESLKQKTATDIFHWQALFKGATFKLSAPTSDEPVWYNLGIRHDGLGLYLLVGTGLIFSLIALLIYRRRLHVENAGHAGLIPIVSLSAISWAAAEMTVDTFYNHRVGQPFAAWLFVAMLAVIAITSVVLDVKHSKEHRVK
ncbi:MAG: hypothetical protein EPO42_11890 [Gallionellaceae bacterium]|nr:MAG: hypothetical protein EPO42_11890 [Gallionellaceae bacterium]